MLRAPRTSQKAAKASWMKPPTRRTRCDQAATGASSAPDGHLGGGHAVLVWVRYQATVSATAAASGVPVVPKVDWNLVVSRMKGSSNS